MTHDLMNYLAEKPIFAVGVAVCSSILNRFDILAWVKDFTAIGAAVVVALTIISLGQRIFLDFRKILNKD